MSITNLSGGLTALPYRVLYPQSFLWLGSLSVAGSSFDACTSEGLLVGSSSSVWSNLSSFIIFLHRTSTNWNSYLSD